MSTFIMLILEIATLGVMLFFIKNGLKRYYYGDSIKGALAKIERLEEDSVVLSYSEDGDRHEGKVNVDMFLNKISGTKYDIKGSIEDNIGDIVAICYDTEDKDFILPITIEEYRVNQKFIRLAMFFVPFLLIISILKDLHILIRG